MNKILLLSSADSVHTLKWCNGLVARGLDVTLITQQNPLNGYDNRVNIEFLPIKGKKGYILNFLFLKRYLRKNTFDCINVHYVSGYGILARLAGMRNYIASVWGADVFDFPRKSLIHKKIVESNLNAASVICSTSIVMAKYVRENLNVNPKIDIEITPFGIDVSKFRKLKLSGDKNKEIKIGTVKTLRPKYGIDILIQAFSLVSNKYDNLKLEIAGIGHQLDELKSLTQKLKIEDKVDFLGWVNNDDVPMVLNTFDIYVAPSTLDSESFGVAIIEASACELPVVVSDVGGLPEVVLHNKTGLVVKRRSVTDLAKAIELLIESPELRVSMGINGRKNVLNCYEWESCVDKMKLVYEKYQDRTYHDYS
ncbi:glycosyltransferase family 4 protein [Shewanella chilikensis]|uniref:glycosyltransferase family 4 protein n=1 Tax=Shewanella chilikensis TaxID=558541 RepID=UPI0039999A74